MPDEDGGTALECTTCPDVVDTGETAPVDPDIDPGDYDSATAETFAPADVSQYDAVFTMGVQTGAMRADGMYVWTQGGRETARRGASTHSVL